MACLSSDTGTIAGRRDQDWAETGALSIGGFLSRLLRRPIRSATARKFMGYQVTKTPIR
ncbi:hypothetical protein RSSM_03159 [Rhodopirellula sallentina SM41]|uniref:Uncharacterized protein n=1 Tax=Rhodopirellula sallentina SM41 TaxID=1263870 RepID=M5U1L1_9BACT|nr:hypothetical protein RSSM_03159 [Rhodopirellula sallentina SM41]